MVSLKSFWLGPASNVIYSPEPGADKHFKLKTKMLIILDSVDSFLFKQEATLIGCNSSYTHS